MRHNNMKIEDDNDSVCSYCTTNLILGVLVGFGLVLAIPSAFFMIFFEMIVESKLVLEKGTETFKAWESPPVPVYISFHFFNYTNVEDIALNHSRPNVTELGPYVYKEVRINHVIDYTDAEITYLQNYSYIYDAERSCASCAESDVIFTPSVTSITIMNILHDKVDGAGPIAKVVDHFLRELKQISLFKKLSIKEILWGYNDSMITMVKDIEDFLQGIGIELPDIKFPSVALQLNSTAGMLDTGNITCLTGRENIKDVQKITHWRGKDISPYWLTEYGNMINGTDGTRTAPFLSKDDKLFVFVFQLCRSLYVEYSNDINVKGINTYQFTTSPDLFANFTLNPDNAAFCTKDRCWGSGLLPMSTCRPGVPIFMSAPHFYQADEKFAGAINGMSPNKLLHRTYLNVEPNTGLVVEAHKRLQINVMAEKSFLSLTKPLENTFNLLPIVFADEGASIDDKSAQQLKDQVLYTKTRLQIIQFVLIGAGAAMLLYAVVLISMILLKNQNVKTTKNY